MSYHATARSNPFRVKNMLAFASLVALLPGVRLEHKGDQATLYVDGTDSGEFPTHRLLAEGEAQSAGEMEGHTPFDVCDDIAPHLVDGEVAIFITAGSDRHRYVGGYARAVNSRGRSIIIQLDDIYAQAKLLLGAAPTTLQASESPVPIGVAPWRADRSPKNLLVSGERLALLLTAIDPMDLTDEEKLWLDEIQNAAGSVAGTLLSCAAHEHRHGVSTFLIRHPVGWDTDGIKDALQKSDPEQYEFGPEGPDYLNTSQADEGIVHVG